MYSHTFKLRSAVSKLSGSYDAYLPQFRHSNLTFRCFRTALKVCTTSFWVACSISVRTQRQWRTSTPGAAMTTSRRRTCSVMCGATRSLTWAWRVSTTGPCWVSNARRSSSYPYAPGLLLQLARIAVTVTYHGLIGSNETLCPKSIL